MDEAIENVSAGYHRLVFTHTHSVARWPSLSVRLLPVSVKWESQLESWNYVFTSYHISTTRLYIAHFIIEPSYMWKRFFILFIRFVIYNMLCHASQGHRILECLFSQCRLNQTAIQINWDRLRFSGFKIWLFIRFFIIPPLSRNRSYGASPVCSILLFSYSHYIFLYIFTNLLLVS